MADRDLTFEAIQQGVRQAGKESLKDANQPFVGIVSVLETLRVHSPQRDLNQVSRRLPKVGLSIMCHTRLMSESEQTSVGRLAAPSRFAAQSLCVGVLPSGSTNPNGASLPGEEPPLRLLT